jgi:tetratricopeptide (TPR) repeat protein
MFGRISCALMAVALVLAPHSVDAQRGRRQRQARERAERAERERAEAEEAPEVTEPEEEPEPEEEEARHEPPPQTSDRPVADDEARGLFLAGEAAFRDARWEDAIRYFRDAYRLSPRPGLLYNIGVSADRLRRDTEALEAFEHFLREIGDQDAPHRHDAEARVEVLRRAIAEGRVAPPPTSGGGDVAAGMTVFGVSVAVLSAGAIMLGVGQADADTVESAPDGTPWLEVEEAAGRADLLRNLGWVFLGVGTAGAIFGMSWAIVEGTRTESPSARLEFLPNGARVRGVF